MDVYLICYLASYLFARAEHYYLSGFVLLMAAAYLYWHDYSRTKNVVHLRALFSFFWIFGQSLACFKLSRLQRPWSSVTWICFLVALTGFWYTYELLERNFGAPEDFQRNYRSRKRYSKSLFEIMAGLTALSVAAFLFEAIKLGFVPLFVRGVPHAYSEFHVSGVHYFTVASVLVPACSVLWFQDVRRREGWRRPAVIAMDVAAFLIPILCVSRFQMILAVLLAFVVLVIGSRDVRLGYFGIAVAVIIPLYLILTVARSHDVEYLNGIFEMKNSHMPVFITQPYMYIANNYDNFDCMVRHLGQHAWGMRSLFPLWALTGLKFLYPALINYPIIVNKEELTTLTLFYDSYYDFGVTGVVVFACLLGALSYWLVTRVRKMQNPAAILFYGQMAAYVIFSFFTTWFSNPATWFYFAVTGAMAVYCALRE